MPQTYLHDGDTWQPIDRNRYGGQTFRVETPFTLEWIDLNFKFSPFVDMPMLQIFLADGLHFPFGNMLSWDQRWLREFYDPAVSYRTRWLMTPYLLTPDYYYFLRVLTHGANLLFPHHWLYDKEDATYPRGIRLTSTDQGETWTRHYDDDHLFAVFGTPPAPPPPPEPPVFNWAALDIKQVITRTGYKIVAVTNVPCHLTMYWTNIVPRKHATPIIRRGVYWKDAIRYCFVKWEENEQEEAGDTIYHTFIKEPWPHCETRWFVFRGKVDDEWVPSISPIFKKHRLVPEYWLIIRELWEIYVEPPEFTRIILERWSVIAPQPEWTIIITEPWTPSEEEPGWSQIISELWTSSEEAPQWNKIIEEPWTS